MSGLGRRRRSRDRRASRSVRAPTDATVRRAVASIVACGLGPPRRVAARIAGTAVAVATASGRPSRSRCLRHRTLARRRRRRAGACVPCTARRRARRVVGHGADAVPSGRRRAAGRARRPTTRPASTSRCRAASQPHRRGSSRATTRRAPSRVVGSRRLVPSAHGPTSRRSAASSRCAAPRCRAVQQRSRPDRVDAFGRRWHVRSGCGSPAPTAAAATLPSGTARHRAELVAMRLASAAVVRPRPAGSADRRPRARRPVATARAHHASIVEPRPRLTAPVDVSGSSPTTAVATYRR